MSKPLVVYVAGPYSAPTFEETRDNVVDVSNAALKVLKRNHVPVFPHGMGWFLEPAAIYRDARWFDRERILAWCLALLARCDCLLFLGSSPGADRELARARELGIPVYERVEDLPEVDDTYGVAHRAHYGYSQTATDEHVATEEKLADVATVRCPQCGRMVKVVTVPFETRDTWCRTENREEG